MINFSTIYGTLYTVVNSIINTPTQRAALVFADQNAPAPAKPYVYMRLNSINQIFDDETGPIDEDGETNMRGFREFTLEIQSIGSGAIGFIHEIETSFQKYTTRNILWQNNIAYIRQLNITNLSEVYESRFQERASADFQFRTGIDYVDDIGIIETVILNGKYLQINGKKIELQNTIEGG